MIGLRISLFTFALFSPLNAETITSSLSKSLESRAHGRELAHHRKLLTVVDPTKAFDGRYIAVFHYDAVQNVTEKVESMFGKEQVLYEYDNIALKGAAIQNVTTEQLEQMEMDSDILYIAPEIGMTYATNNTIQNIQNATYNLDRLDNKFLPLNGKYKRKSDGGNGVTAYVLDSGIRASHVEFEGRASCGYDAVLGHESNISCDDLAGHGTHVAGLIGGKTVGVAVGVTIVSVKVATKDFELAAGGIIKGIEFVLGEKQRNPLKPMVANLSFGTEKYPFFDVMVEALLRLNVTVVAAAGNFGTNACVFSPAGVRGVITVGASDELDEVPFWSNFGSCVDIHAPGNNIISAGKRDDTRYTMASGTSQSAPMVAGVAALYLQLLPSLTPARVSQLLILDSLKNVLTPGPDEFTNITASISKNRLLNTRIFTDAHPSRPNATCPYGARKLFLCYQEGWWIK